MFVEIWALGLLHVTLIASLWYCHYERQKRKQHETIVAKLRDKEILDEQQVVLYMGATKYNWLGHKLEKV